MFQQADLVPNDGGVSSAEEAIGGSLNGRAGGNHVIGRLGLGSDNKLALRLLGRGDILLFEEIARAARGQSMP